MKKHTNAKSLDFILKFYNLAIWLLSSLLMAYLVIKDEKIYVLQGDHYRLRSFFSYQFVSLLNGNLNVQPEALPGECFYRDNNCYGYFGLAPSILRAPLYWFFGMGSYSALLNFVANSLSMFVALKLLKYILLQVAKFSHLKIFSLVNKREKVFFSIFYISLALSITGFSFLIQLTNPGAYEEAMSWYILFSLVGIYSFSKWILEGETVLILISLVSLTLAANSRPGGGIIAVLIGIIGIVVSYQSSNLGKRSNYLPLISIILIPAGTALLVYYLKFHTLVPSLALNESIPEHPDFARLLESNKGVYVSPKYIPTNLLGYFRPDSLKLVGRSLEIARPTYSKTPEIWPILPDSMYITPTASAPVVASVACYGFGFLMLSLIKRSFLTKTTRVNLYFKQNHLLVIPLLVLGGAIPTLMSFHMQNRYLGDFVPSLISITSLMPTLLFIGSANLSSGKAAKGVFTIIVLTIIQGIVNFRLALLY